ncbi:MAG: radical SAM protein [Thermoplasmatales archaeon]|nr:MAG: radical SAM protein [Thermoplasmatales archaeon]
MKVIILFPPGWSFNVGSPHLGIPLITGMLKKHGISVKARDLNWEIAKYYGVNIGIEEIKRSVKIGTLESLNEPYFQAEDTLMDIARRYDGVWNLQLGFKFNRFSFNSSKDVLNAMKMKSPFTWFYKEKIIPWIDQEKPTVLGFGLASIYQLIPTFHLCWLLKQNQFKGTIVLGGNTVSRLKDEFIKVPKVFDYMDVLVIFQGEIPFLKLCQNIMENKRLDDIPNIVWKDQDLIKSNPLTCKQDPNYIPTPDFKDFPIGKYWGINYYPLVSTRGCYYNKCTFCSIPYGYGGFGGMRRAELIFQDMCKLSKRCDVILFKFMDEAMPPNIMKKLAELIIQHRSPFEWESFARLEKCWQNANFMDCLANGGFKKAYFGLEIYSDTSRISLNKKDEARHISEILKKCHEYGIKVGLFCMFGFPGTDRDDAERTIDFILEYKDLIDTVDINEYTYAKHTYVPNIQKVEKGKDWCLEYEYYGKTIGILSSREVEELVSEMERILWDECPRLLHPTYRLISPWDKYKEHIYDVEKLMAINKQNISEEDFISIVT